MLWSGYRNRQQAIKAFPVALSFYFLFFTTPTQYMHTNLALSLLPLLECSFTRSFPLPTHLLAHTLVCNGSPRLQLERETRATHLSHVHQTTAIPAAFLCPMHILSKGTDLPFLLSDPEPALSFFLIQGRHFFFFVILFSKLLTPLHFSVAGYSTPCNLFRQLLEAVLELFYCFVSFFNFCPSN